MLVAIANHKDATEFVHDSGNLAPQYRENFFDIFGTTGCVLNCKGSARQDVELNQAEEKQCREVKREMKASQAEYRKKLSSTWFTASDIATSAVKGCGSCSVLSQILVVVFDDTQQSQPRAYEYSVSHDFKLKRRRLGEERYVEMVQLFQPPGLRMRFEQMHQSSFLDGKDSSIAKLRQWLNECLNNHEECSISSGAQNINNRPARLLDLTSTRRGNEDGIKIIETKPGSAYKYACLSHRWDAVVNQHQTTTGTTGNLSKRLEFISLQDLPANFRDAVLIARGVGLNILWIDSLCIIQDGDDHADLNRELMKMGSIYRNAELTIAAVCSPDSSQGCFGKDIKSDIRFRISHNLQGEFLIGARVLEKICRPDSMDIVKELHPLLTRAWVFQERMLSPRVLLCNYGEFAFECLGFSICECVSTIAPHFKPAYKWLGSLDSSDSQILKGPNRNLAEGALKAWKDNAVDHWRTIIQTYMQLSLSFSSDVLPAISGFAQLLANHLKYDYVAGMWKETLASDLLWYVKPQATDRFPRPRPRDSFAPSWSWASIEMTQNIKHVKPEKNFMVRASDLLLREAIVEIYCEPQSPINPFGKLKDAYLKFSARLYPWYIRRFCRKAHNKMSRKNRRAVKDLHVTRPNHGSIACTTEPRQLDIGDAVIMLEFDAQLGREDIVYKNFDYCIGDPAYVESGCALAQVYLLHALHSEAGSQNSLDALLLLKRIPPIDGRRNCYRRIGLMTLTNNRIHAQFSSEIFRSQMQAQMEEFYLF